MVSCPGNKGKKLEDQILTSTALLEFVDFLQKKYVLPLVNR